MSGHTQPLALFTQFVNTLPRTAAWHSIKRQIENIIIGRRHVEFVGCLLTQDILASILNWCRENVPIQFANIESFKIDISHEPATLRAGMLDGLLSLRYFSVNGWALHIEEGAFRNLPLLEKIKLNRCHIQRLAVGMIQYCPAIKELNLERNNIQVIEPGFFSNLPMLEKIYLAQNSLSRSLPEGVFTRLLTLKELSFGNQMYTLHQRSINNLPSLERLIVSSRMIFTVDFLQALGSTKLKYIGGKSFYDARCYYHMSGEMRIRDFATNQGALLKCIYTQPWRGVIGELFGEKHYYFKSAVQVLTSKKILQHARRSCFIVAATVIGRNELSSFACFKNVFAQAGAGSGSSAVARSDADLSMTIKDKRYLSELPLALKQLILAYALPLNPLTQASSSVALDVSLSEMGVTADTSRFRVARLFNERFSAYPPELKSSYFCRR